MGNNFCHQSSFLSSTLHLQNETKRSEMKLRSWHFFNKEAKQTSPIPKFLKIESKRTLLFQELKKNEAKRPLLITDIRKIEAKLTRLIL
jgi:hypothetical protein